MLSPRRSDCFVLTWNCKYDLILDVRIFYGQLSEIFSHFLCSVEPLGQCLWVQALYEADCL
ncbi:MAG: hypothetical protein CMN98_10870 [Synechococcus sp. NP17]|nr:hypothetical protein [Synechococcus sp. NP17]